MKGANRYLVLFFNNSVYHQRRISLGPIPLRYSNRYLINRLSIKTVKTNLQSHRIAQASDNAINPTVSELNPYYFASKITPPLVIVRKDKRDNVQLIWIWSFFTWE